VGAPTELRYEEHGHVGIVTLDRPEARNALTHTTYRELEEVVRATTARCLVITGADPAFCSGDDVKQVLAVTGSSAAATAAIGWGVELALMADLRVASERARFGELFVKRGLCCDVAGLGRLTQLVGREHAAELLLTGRVIDADEALRIGLVGRVVPHDELLPTALGLATEIAENPPLAVQRLKRGLREALDPDWSELGAWVTASLGELMRTEDHREGVAAFLEKREPRYTGR
jgi:enoyl-CoA hydratase/carnithine racemase